jgi:nitrogen fixation NifU-like protein
MPNMRRLYQEIILDHGKRPRNRRAMPDADLQAEGINPLCGDRITLYLKLNGGIIDRICFQGSGCIISIASASMLTEAVRGKSSAESSVMIDAVADLAGGGEMPDGLEALTGAAEFPVRIKCATLPWRTLRAALDDDHGVVTTE